MSRLLYIRDFWEVAGGEDEASLLEEVEGKLHPGVGVPMGDRLREFGKDINLGTHITLSDVIGPLNMGCRSAKIFVGGTRYALRRANFQNPSLEGWLPVSKLCEALDKYTLNTRVPFNEVTLVQIGLTTGASWR